MHKFLLSLSLLFSTEQLLALPLHNPADPILLTQNFFNKYISEHQKFHFSFGFYGDYVFNRYLEVRNDLGDPDLEHTKIFTNATYFSVNFFETFTLFSTLGESQIVLNANNRAFDFGGSGRYFIQSSSDFSWSLGGRCVLMDYCNFIAAIEAQYFSTKTPAVQTTIDNISIYPNSNFLKYKEWQVGFGIAYTLAPLVPYVAVKFSHANLKFNEPFLTNVPFTLKNKKHWGLASGFSVIDCQSFSLTLEGRFGDEKAFYINGQINY